MDENTFNQFLIINQIVIEKSTVTCGKCNNWLTQPIQLVNGVNYCGQCTEKNGERNVALEDVLNLFKYPCVRDSCEYLSNYREIIKHVNNCSNAPSFTKCTFCQIECNNSNIRDHFVNEHKALGIDTDKPTFRLTINVPVTKMNMHLVEMNNAQFLFYYTQEVDVLKGTLMKLNHENDVNKYIIHMTTSSGKSSTHDGVLQPFGTPQSTANETELYIGKSKSCDLEISLGPRQHLDTPECPICLNVIGRKLRQCINGHNVCEDCGVKINTCPICRQKMTDHVFNIRHLYPKNKTLWPCTNHKSGCMAYFSDMQQYEKHPDACAFRNVNCCACTLKIRKCDLITHMKNAHALHNNFCVVESSLTAFNRKGSYTTFIVFDSKVFECIITSDDFDVKFTCHLAYSKDQCSHEYLFEFQIILDSNSTKAVHVTNDVVCKKSTIHSISWHKLSQFATPLLVRCCISKHCSLFAIPCVTRVFFEISGESKSLGRIIMELRNDIAPKTAENFRALCTHQNGYGYKGIKFFLVNPNLFCQVNDVLDNHNSIECDDRFDRENTLLKYSGLGTLVMRDTSYSCSSFFIMNCEEAPDWFYDAKKKYVIFGQVVEGLDVIKKMESFEPSKLCIVNCGQL